MYQVRALMNNDIQGHRINGDTGESRICARKT